MSKKKSNKDENGDGHSYEDQLRPLQVELNGVMRLLKDRGERVVVLFEGRDTAGKGGAIKAITEKLNTRQCHIAALGVPTARETSTNGISSATSPTCLQCRRDDAVRSKLVQPRRRRGSDGLLHAGADRRLPEGRRPIFEKMLVDDGIRLFKYWLAVDQAEQEQRFADRQDDPLKQWKLSPVDLQARTKYDEYGRARDRMLEATHTKAAPWTLVDFNDQKAGRLKLIANLLSRLPVATATAPEVEIPPLLGKPLKEKFRGPLKPI
jgi:polyphosphate kinase 2 (PPK2 family)